MVEGSPGMGLSSWKGHIPTSLFLTLSKLFTCTATELGRDLPTGRGTLVLRE